MRGEGEGERGIMLCEAWRDDVHFAAMVRGGLDLSSSVRCCGVAAV